MGLFDDVLTEERKPGEPLFPEVAQPAPAPAQTEQIKPVEQKTTEAPLSFKPPPESEGVRSDAPETSDPIKGSGGGLFSQELEILKTRESFDSGNLFPEADDFKPEEQQDKRRSELIEGVKSLAKGFQGLMTKTSGELARDVGKSILDQFTEKTPGEEVKGKFRELRERGYSPRASMDLALDEVRSDRKFKALVKDMSADPAIRAWLKTKDGRRKARVISGTVMKTFSSALNFPAAAEEYTGLETGIGAPLEKAADYLTTLAEEINPKDQKFSDQMVSGAVSLGMFMVPGVATARAMALIPRMGAFAAKMAPWIGSSVSALLEAAVESGGKFEEQKNSGIGREKAAKEAFHSFWSNALVIGITNKFGVFGEAGGKLKRMIASSSLEGIQEGAQQIIDDVVSGRDIDWAAVLDSTGVGALTGPAGNLVLNSEVVSPKRLDPELFTQDSMNFISQNYPSFTQIAFGKDYKIGVDNLRRALKTSLEAGENVRLRGGNQDQYEDAAINKFFDLTKDTLIGLNQPKNLPSIEESLEKLDPERQVNERLKEIEESEKVPQSPGLDDVVESLGLRPSELDDEQFMQVYGTPRPKDQTVPKVVSDAPDVQIEGEPTPGFLGQIDFTDEPGAEFDSVYEPNKKLTPEEAALQDRGSRFARENLNAILEEYEKIKGNYVNTDDFRNLMIPAGYTPEHANAYHQPASAVKEVYKRRVLEQAQRDGLKRVIYSAGGPGSGKTTLFDNVLDHTDLGAGIDTTLANYGNAERELDHLIENGAEPEIAYVYRDPVDAYLKGVLDRMKEGERVVPIDVHIEQHVESKKNIQRLAARYGDKLQIQPFETVSEQRTFRKISLEDLANRGYNLEDVKRRITDGVTEAYRKNEITESQFNRATSERVPSGPLSGSQTGVPEAPPGSAPETSPQETDTRSIYEQIRNRLIRADTSYEDADVQAQVYESAFRSLASRAGLSPLELFEAYAPQIVRQEAFDPTSPNILEQSAFHGSPHKFEEFSLQKIGTGEGAQTFGWGLYFAGKKEVAEYYRERLAFKEKKTVFYKGKAVTNDSIREGLTPEQVFWLKDIGAGANQSVQDEIRAVENDIKDGERRQINPDVLKTWRENLAFLKSLDPKDIEVSGKKGRLYKVDIPEDNEYLDWDKPLSEQSEKVKEALAKAINPKVTTRPVGEKLTDVLINGESLGVWPNDKADAVAKKWFDHYPVEGQFIYRAIVRDVARDPKNYGKAPEMASRKLSELGIPGIKYADQYSRVSKDADIENVKNQLRTAKERLAQWEGKPSAHSPELVEEQVKNFKDQVTHYESILEASQGKLTSNYVVFDDKLVKIMEFEQSKEGEDPRANIQFGNTSININLFKTADKSSFLHETGHLYLKMLGDLSALPTATPELKADADTILGWLKAETFDSITREQNEKFARGFEAYLREGKAPSSKLQVAFEKFKEWLTDIYHAVTDLNVELSDEVRQVFDRVVGFDPKQGTFPGDVVNQLTISKKDRQDLIRSFLPSRRREPKLYTERAALRIALQRESKAAARGYEQGISDITQRRMGIIEVATNFLPETESADLIAKANRVRTNREMSDLLDEVFRRSIEIEQVGEKFVEYRLAIKRQLQAARAAAAAESRRILELQKNLAGLIRNRVPKSERGGFLNVLQKARNEKDVIRVNKLIDSSIEKFQKKMLIQSIKRESQRLEASQSIAVDYKQRIRDLLGDIIFSKPRASTIQKLKNLEDYVAEQRRAGRDVTVPLYVLDRLKILSAVPIRDMKTVDLEDILGQMQVLADLGKTKIRVQKELDRLNKEKDLADLAHGSVPINSRELARRAPAQTLPFNDKIKNFYKTQFNRVKNVDLAIMPMDVIIDILDGSQGFKGANYRIFKARGDRTFNNYLNRRDRIQKQFEKVVEGLDEASAERIGVHAAASQEGGIEKLANAGITLEEIQAIKLTPRELQVYNWMRNRLDASRPEVARVMRTVYNEEVGEVANYFPFMTDFDMDTEQAINDRLNLELIGLKKNTKFGFTKERTAAGQQKIRINAFEIFSRHMDDVAYLVEMAETVKYMGEIAASDDYAQAVGNVGQQYMREWVDLLAKKGAGVGGQQLGILDRFRVGLGAAQFGFKASTALIQLSAVNQGGAIIGHWTYKGMYNIAQKNWREFLRDNMPEIRNRVGYDPEFQEFGKSKFVKGIKEIGFYPLQKIDHLAAASVAAGAYEKYLHDNGLKMDFSKPNQEAIEYAQRVVRRTQASPFFKDLPLALSRGKFTGNKSLDRLIFQWKTFTLNEFSLIRHEGFRSGIQKGNALQTANVALFVTMGALAETGIRMSVSEALNFLTGAEDDDEEDWGFTKDVLSEITRKIPFLSEAVSAITYESFPVPVIGAMYRGIQGARQIIRSSSLKSAAKGTVKLGGAVGRLAGVPGTAQAEELARKALSAGPKLKTRSGRIRKFRQPSKRQMKERKRMMKERQKMRKRRMRDR